MQVIRSEKHRGPRLTVEMLTKAETALVEIDWRLLHWLLRYPLQRADDLLVGVARWASRATVYRHLQVLETRGLVESVLPKTPGDGKYLYHLSNLGLHVLATSLEKSAQDLAQCWHADEGGLLRLLPRLPTLFLLQDVVNGLVTGAAEAMASKGRRPQLVRWTWQRDATHLFQYREKPMRWFADGVVALCIRTQQEKGGTLDQWFGLLLLGTELDDERLMRLRLERLLCWRESPERWSVYQHMPPVLILARSPRQCDHWQRAVESAALQLRMDPPSGALACLPQPEERQIYPWRLAWRALSTDVPCRLQHLLRPLPRTALPPLLFSEEDEDEGRQAQSTSHASAAEAAPGTPVRLKRLIVGDLAGRASHIVQECRGEPEVMALRALRLTLRQWGILRLLLAHPLLSDDELGAFLNLQRQSVRCALYGLYLLDCLRSIPTEVGKRWLLSEPGLHLLATANHLHVRTLAVESSDGGVGEPLRREQRGAAWLFRHLRHTAGIYGFFAALARLANQEPERALCWWETGAVCERRYQVGEQWYNLRPDALAAYRAGPRHFRFWLEWDRGTMNARDLTVKFEAYANYVASREWAREFASVPWLLCVAPDIAQERRIQRAGRTSLTYIPGIVLWSTSEVLLHEYGPLAPVWVRVSPVSDQSAQSGRSARQCLFDATG